mmetsp:Transcript_25061/g.62981  ORF Transcript_25061/g.62981 Transcript_25061/m.62981 type:complete len:265 (-) Transcript_25061:745-1539(-)
MVFVAIGAQPHTKCHLDVARVVVVHFAHTEMVREGVVQQLANLEGLQQSCLVCDAGDQRRVRCAAQRGGGACICPVVVAVAPLRELCWRGGGLAKVELGGDVLHVVDDHAGVEGQADVVASDIHRHAVLARIHSWEPISEGEVQVVYVFVPAPEVRVAHVLVKRPQRVASAHVQQGMETGGRGAFLHLEDGAAVVRGVDGVVVGLHNVSETVLVNKREVGHRRIHIGPLRPDDVYKTHGLAMRGASAQGHLPGGCHIFKDCNGV